LFCDYESIASIYFAVKPIVDAKKVTTTGNDEMKMSIFFHLIMQMTVCLLMHFACGIYLSL